MKWGTHILSSGGGRNWSHRWRRPCCQDICIPQQAAICGKTPTIVTWSERCYCCAIKTNSRRIRSQVCPRNGADISELQAHHCTTPGPRTWLLCSVFPANKLSLQELNHLIGIDLLTSTFLGHFCCNAQFPRGKGANTRFTPPAEAHARRVFSSAHI